jgi:uncharacterized protein (UPF0333 family)
MNRSRGQGLAEYALIFVIIVIIAIASLVIVGNVNKSSLSYIGSSIR